MKNEKINLFSRKGLQKMFPGAKIRREKGRWTVTFPIPTDLRPLNRFPIKPK